MKATLSPTGQIIEQILELSADAQITRRMAARNSPLFDSLAGAITAYGKVLALLVAFQEHEEFLSALDQLEGCDSAGTSVN
jgi:hypothetical protein